MRSLCEGLQTCDSSVGDMPSTIFVLSIPNRQRSVFTPFYFARKRTFKTLHLCNYSTISLCPYKVMTIHIKKHSMGAYTNSTCLCETSIDPLSNLGERERVSYCSGKEEAIRSTTEICSEGIESLKVPWRLWKQNAIQPSSIEASGPSAFYHCSVWKTRLSVNNEEAVSAKQRCERVQDAWNRE